MIKITKIIRIEKLIEGRKMTDLELLKEIDSRLDDEMKDILASIADLELLQETTDRLITIEHIRAERVTEIRHRMLAYAQTRLQNVEKELQLLAD